MIDERKADIQRGRVEDAARALHPGERLWLELRPGGHGLRGAKWKAVVCRPEDVGAVLAGRNDGGASFELEHPAQLPEWLEFLRVHPAQPVPPHWERLVFFGCDVDRTG